MEALARFLHADALKLRRTPFFIVHAAVPLGVAAVFLAYLSFTEYAAAGLMAAYLQVVGIGMPLAAALATSIAADQETDAGGGFFLLVAPSRGATLASKLIFLAVSGLASCLAAVLLFAGGAALLQPGFQPEFSTCVLQGLVLWAAALFLYLLHTWLSLRFGRNANFAAAAFEMLLAALMITGLGETVWFAVPCAWPARMVGLVGQVGGGTLPAPSILPVGLAVAAVATAVASVLLFAWIRCWEGYKSEED